ncbi:MAG: hypothetical protein K8R79_03825 [Calditrichales bacterium]|nr:hypothetical protein [Calditrichales bacterium]
MKNFFIGVLLLFLFCNNLFCQKQIWEIMCYSDQPYKNVVLYKLSDDTLYLKALGNIYPISVKSIVYLKRERKSYAGSGLVLGMVGGGIIGNQTSKNAEDKNAFYSELGIILGTGLGIIVGGIFGFAIGEGLGADEYYNFTKRSIDEKKILLLQLIQRDND